MAEPKSFEETHAETIAAKIRAGLSATQAVAVVRAQVEHDAALAKKSAADKTEKDDGRKK